MPRVFPALFLVLAFFQASLHSAPATAGGLITKRGTFPSPSGSYILVIEFKSTSLVDYKIVHVATKKEHAPDRLFSDAMRWAAFWENDDTLWVHSSDIGLSVWKRHAEGGLTQEWLGPNSSLVPSIPTEIWDYLPSSSHRQWKHQRRSD